MEEEEKKDGEKPRYEIKIEDGSAPATEQKPPIFEEQHPPVDEIDESKVLSFIESKFGKKVENLESLFEERQPAQQLDLDDEVKAIARYKAETGRGLEDYIRLQKDYTKVPHEKLLGDFIMETRKGLDEQDVNILLDRFWFDDDDDSHEAQLARIEKKEMVAKAIEHFEAQKSRYKAPSEQAVANAELAEKAKAYETYVAQTESAQAELQKRQQLFTQETDKVFSKDFGGFGFKVGDREVKFVPGSPEEIKKAQSNLGDAIGKHLNADGSIKDAAGYHKSLAAYRDPDGLASYFYELGRSEAIDKTTRDIKNIDMGERKTPNGLGSNRYSVIVEK